MIEILDSAVTVAGMLLGFILGRRERNFRRPVLYPCDCGHSLSKHRPGDGKKTTTDCMECSCRQYIGQRPINLDLDPKQLGQ